MGKGTCQSYHLFPSGVLPKAALFALPVGIACAVVTSLEENEWHTKTLQAWNVKSAGYTAFCSLLAFLVVFRSSQAYSRYWKGCQLAQAMIGNFFDATSGIVSFTISSKADQERIVEFKQTIIAMTSLLTAVCFCDMAMMDAQSEKLPGLETIGWQNWDDETKLAVQKTGDEKVQLCFFWWQCYASMAVNEGVLNVPPPILSRVFAQMGAGLHCYEQATQLSEVPFPFHYTHATVWLLFIHMIFTPLAVTTWTERPLLAFLFSFILVFVFVALFLISAQLEHPFGEDEADVDVCELQTRSNANLRLLLTEEATRTPIFSEGRRRGNANMDNAPGTCLLRDTAKVGDISSSDDERSGVLLSLS